MDTDTRLLHQTVLRLLKGALRAYETWLRVKLGQEPPSIELPLPTTPAAAATTQPAHSHRNGDSP